MQCLHAYPPSPIQLATLVGGDASTSPSIATPESVLVGKPHQIPWSYAYRSPLYRLGTSRYHRDFIFAQKVTSSSAGRAFLNDGCR